MRTREVYKRFRDAVELQGIDAGSVEALSPEAVRQMVGGEAMTVTFLKNMKSRVARKLQDREDAAVGVWIESKVVERFPLAKVRMAERKVAVVYLDGVEEVEI